ncbi:MAG: hypothetical protein IT562_14515 [Alphaproteobacteria bacterium]|nr:hypothetical protein [Alphaproteobacteria bacterium]
MTRAIKRSLFALPLLAALAAPALAADVPTYVIVRPGYGFNGALQDTVRQTDAAPAYIGPGYAYTAQGYVYTGPVYATTSVAAAPAVVAPVAPPAVIAYPPAPPPAAYPPPPRGPILSKDEIEDRLDKQGYDDIDVGVRQSGFYMVKAKDRNDAKLWLRVDATTGYVAEVTARR